MKELVPMVWDDLDRTEKNTKTPASVTRRIGLDGVWKELDLTDEHDAELIEFIDRYMQAGLTPDKPPKPARPVRAAPGTGVSERAHGRRTKEYYEQLIAYVDKNRITKRDGSGRPAYEGSPGQGGRKDFPSWLVYEFDEYLARQDQPA